MFARSEASRLRAERDLLARRMRRLEDMLATPGECDRSRTILLACLAELREESALVSAALAALAPEVPAAQRAAFLALVENGGAA